MYVDEIRAHALILFSCIADDALFLEWEDLSEASKQEFEDNGPIPCEGRGFAGIWCERCRFGQTEELENETV
jgi:hypothetical protein